MLAMGCRVGGGTTQPVCPSSLVFGETKYFLDFWLLRADCLQQEVPATTLGLLVQHYSQLSVTSTWGVATSLWPLSLSLKVEFNGSSLNNNKVKK